MRLLASSSAQKSGVFSIASIGTKAHQGHFGTAAKNGIESTRRSGIAESESYSAQVKPALVIISGGKAPIV